MIRTQACAKAQIINAQLKQGGNWASPVEGTPLSTLVSQGVSPIFGLPSDEQNNLNDTEITSMMSDMSSKDLSGSDAHQSLKQDTVKMVSSVVRRTLYMARNIALPLINDITEQVDGELQRLIPVTGLALTVQESPVVKLLNNSTLTNVVERYSANINGRDANNAPVHAPRSSSDIYELIKVGMSDFDDSVEKFLIPYLGDSTIQDLYNKVFVSGSPTVKMSSIINVGDNLQVAANAIICLLIGSALTKADDDIDMTAASYDNAMAGVMRVCGNKIVAAQKQVQFRKSADVVVINYPSSGKEAAFLNSETAVITVDPTTYNKFLDAGGTPEMIMGSYLVDRQIALTKILENADKYIKAYNSRVESLKSETRLQELTTMRRVLQTRVSAEIARATGDISLRNAIDLEEGGSLDVNPWGNLVLQSPDVAQKLLVEKIRKLNHQSVTDIYTAVRDIVLDIFFSQTDVRRILDIIDSFGDSDDVGQVVNLAVVYYVCDWVLEQMAFENKDS